MNWLSALFFVETASLVKKAPLTSWIWGPLGLSTRFSRPQRLSTTWKLYFLQGKYQKSAPKRNEIALQQVLTKFSLPLSLLRPTKEDLLGLEANSNDIWADFSGFLCPHKVELAQPRRLLNVERQWRVILNDGQNFQQTVRLESCVKVWYCSSH